MKKKRFYSYMKSALFGFLIFFVGFLIWLVIISMILFLNVKADFIKVSELYNFHQYKSETESGTYSFGYSFGYFNSTIISGYGKFNSTYDDSFFISNSLTYDGKIELINGVETYYDPIFTRKQIKEYYDILNISKDTGLVKISFWDYDLCNGYYFDYERTIDVYTCNEDMNLRGRIIKKEDWVLFTLAHELGHHFDNKELRADNFAVNKLSPNPNIFYS